MSMFSVKLTPVQFWRETYTQIYHLLTYYSSLLLEDWSRDENCKRCWKFLTAKSLSHLQLPEIALRIFEMNVGHNNIGGQFVNENIDFELKCLLTIDFVQHRGKNHYSGRLSDEKNYCMNHMIVKNFHSFIIHKNNWYSFDDRLDQIHYHCFG